MVAHQKTYCGEGWGGEALRCPGLERPRGHDGAPSAARHVSPAPVKALAKKEMSISYARPWRAKRSN
jgi:hypothetical protein